jgi:hypothetical protein
MLRLYTMAEILGVAGIEENVGWVERDETHRHKITKMYTNLPLLLGGVFFTATTAARIITIDHYFY